MNAPIFEIVEISLMEASKMGKNAKNHHKKSLELDFWFCSLWIAPKTKMTLMNALIFEISEISLMEASKMGKNAKNQHKKSLELVFLIL